MGIEYLALMIPFAGMALGGWIAYIAITAEHKQNMAMIEAGMNPKKEEAKKKSQNKLRNAFLFILVPLGIVVGRLLADSIGWSNGRSSLVFAFLFGGLALAGAYFIGEQKKDKDEDEY